MCLGFVANTDHVERNLRRGKLATRCWESLVHCTRHKHRMATCITECFDSDEEAVQPQYRTGRCALRDSFVTILISAARFIEKYGKTPVGATT